MRRLVGHKASLSAAWKKVIKDKLEQLKGGDLFYNDGMDTDDTGIGF